MRSLVKYYEIIPVFTHYQGKTINAKEKKTTKDFYK